jgi:hypothetical protein
MAQPSGRVLSHTDSYRIYLRSSPIISCLDAAAFILRVLITRLLFSFSFHESLNVTIRERYEGYEDTSEGLRSLEKYTWLRWVFFIVGSLGPLVKLMAMRGVPWTKAWGVMFLFAFLVIEVAALIVRKSVDLSVEKDLPGIHYERTAAWTKIARGFEAIERRLFTIGAVAHCTVLLWAFLDLWVLRNSAYIKPGIEEPGWDDSISITALPLSMMALCFAMLFYIMYGSFQMLRDAIHGRFQGRNGVTGVSSFLLLVGGTSFLLWMGIWHFYMLRDSVLFYLGFACLFVLELAIRRLCLLNPWLGEMLLITTAEKDLGVDEYSVWALILCIYSVAIPVLWFWLRYNPEGTVNPSWTAIFG